MKSTMAYENTSEVYTQLQEYFGNSTHSAAVEELSRDQSVVIATYWALMALGAVGNLSVLLTLARTKRKKSRVDLLMTHLAVADISVTCGVIPLEIGWKYTNEWVAGNFLCKVLLVMRAFGLYLSSNVLVCISVDRFFAVLYPLHLTVARKRSKRMLYWAWVVAFGFSLPQSAVFRVLRHPRVERFEQCVSFGAFGSVAHELAYNVWCLCAMYFVPLFVITVCYVCIFWKIRRCSRDLGENCINNTGSSPMRLRRSDHRLLEQARRRTLRMTVTIVTVFALCWLPYATMTMWYMVDRSSASHVSPLVQDLLFAMAVSNSCMNPLVYGSYALRSSGTIRKMWNKLCCWSTEQINNIGNSRSTGKNGRNANLNTPSTNLNEMQLNGDRRGRRCVRFAETSLTVGTRQRRSSRARPPPA